MGKRLVMSVVLVCSMIQVNAQTFGEWFRQNATQRKYLLEQIAALKVYSGYLSKGYGIVRDGAGLVGDIRGQDLSMHEGYFASLAKVNSSVSGQQKAKAALMLMEQMAAIRTATGKLVRQNEWTAGEHGGIIRHLYDLEKEAGKQKDDLELVLQPDRTVMTDDERIARLGKVYGNILESYTDHIKLYRTVDLIVKERVQGIRDASRMRSWHGGGN